jgi:hypothetical protein
VSACEFDRESQKKENTWFSMMKTEFNPFHNMHEIFHKKHWPFWPGFTPCLGLVKGISPAIYEQFKLTVHGFSTTQNVHYYGIYPQRVSLNKNQHWKGNWPSTVYRTASNYWMFKEEGVKCWDSGDRWDKVSHEQLDIGTDHMGTHDCTFNMKT